MHNLFTQLDVLHLVAPYSDPNDWRSLSQVSRLFFQCTLPLIWWHVEGAHNLVSLLPSVEVKVSDNSKRVISVYLNHSSGHELELGRLRIYGPYVRSLEVYGQKSKAYEVLDRNLLARYANASPLLPNLISLTLTALSIPCNDQILWIQLFVAPSVVDIQVIDGSKKYELMTAPMAVDLLHHISATVRELRRFSLLIDGEQGLTHSNNGPVPSMTSLYDWLLRLPRLKELTSSQVVLSKTIFPAITRLWSLEKLVIRGGCTSNDWNEPNASEVSDDPLPALRELSLRGFDVNDAFCALGRPGFKHVCSLRITIGKYPLDVAQDIWPQELIKVVTETCPALAKLFIDFDTSKAEEFVLRDDTSTNIGHPLLPMAKLLLKSVSLHSMSFIAPGPQDLVVTWPLVTRLILPSVGTCWAVLYALSQLPNLLELVLCVNEFDPEEDFIMDEFFSRPTGSLSLRVLGGSIMSDGGNFQANDLARILLHCWPNFREVALKTTYHSKRTSCVARSLRRYFRKITKKVQELRKSKNQQASFDVV